MKNRKLKSGKKVFESCRCRFCQCLRYSTCGCFKRSFCIGFTTKVNDWRYFLDSTCQELISGCLKSVHCHCWVSIALFKAAPLVVETCRAASAYHVLEGFALFFCLQMQTFSKLNTRCIVDLLVQNCMLMMFCFFNAVVWTQRRGCAASIK